MSPSAWPSSSSERPGRRQHPAGRVVAPAQRLEHRLAAQRDRLDRRRPAGDAQHPDDVEAAAARPGDRVRAPQRGRRGPGEDRGGPTAVSGGAGRAEGLVEGLLALPDPSQPSQRGGPHRVRLRGACVVAQRAEGGRRPLGPQDGVAEVPRIVEVGQLALEAGGPALETGVARSERGERGHHGGGLGDVAHRQQGLAALDEDVGASRVLVGEAGQRPTEQPGRTGAIVGLQRPAAGGPQADGRRPAEVVAHQAGLTAEQVGLLELEADQVVVFDELPHLGLEPLRRPLVQVRPCLLQEPPVRGVLHEGVVEAELGLVEPLGARPLEQLLPPEALEVLVELGPDLGAHEVEDRAAGEGPAEDRGRPEHLLLEGAGGRCGPPARRGSTGAPRPCERRPTRSSRRRTAGGRRRRRACARARERTGGCPRWPQPRGRAARRGGRPRRGAPG